MPVSARHRREVQQPQIIPEALVAADAFVIVDAIAAAVEDEPAPVDLDRAGVMRGVAVDQVDTAVDQPSGEADLVVIHVISPVGAPVDGHHGNVTGLLNGLYPADDIVGGAAGQDWAGNRRRAGWRSRPSRAGSRCGRPRTRRSRRGRLPAAGRPPAAGPRPRHARPRRRRRRRWPACRGSPAALGWPKSSTWLLASAHASGRATVTAGRFPGSSGSAPTCLARNRRCG